MHTQTHTHTHTHTQNIISCKYTHTNMSTRKIIISNVQKYKKKVHTDIIPKIMKSLKAFPSMDYSTKGFNNLLVDLI